jgi:hypothetical protein
MIFTFSIEIHSNFLLFVIFLTANCQQVILASANGRFTGAPTQSGFQDILIGKTTKSKSSVPIVTGKKIIV